MEFYALDLETTGLDPSRDEIIEVAWAHFQEGKLCGTYASLVRPSASPPEEILKLTGITEQELATAPAPALVLNEVLRTVSDHVVVAHNVPFDRAFLEKAARTLNAPMPSSWVDTLSVSRAVWPQESSHALSAVRRRLDLDCGPAHRALPDAVAAGRLLLRGIEEAGRFPEGARQALATLLPAILHPLMVPRTARTSDVPREHLPPAHDLDEAFRRLSGRPGWQDRAGQRLYAQTIASTLSEGGVTFLEAGPGTGKTFGYLVPLLLQLAGGRARAIVATRTRALQEQLWHKDLPQALKSLAVSVPSALLKGRENYVCPRQLEHARGRLWKSDLLNTVLVWAERTQTGDLDELAALWAIPDGRRLLSAIRDVPQRCTGRACPLRAHCPSRKARERAREARLVVVNHALLAADLATGGAILGNVHSAVIDEAHALPAAVRDALTIRLTPATVSSLLGELRRGGRGLLASWAKEVDTDPAVRLWEEIRTAHRLVWNTLTPLIPEEAARYGSQLVAAACEPAQRLRQALAELSEELAAVGEKTEGETAELAQTLGTQARFLEQAWSTVLTPVGQNQVFWHAREGTMPSLNASPVELGNPLRTGLWSRLSGAVLTSATLDGGTGVAPLALELGLVPEEVGWYQWPSPFPYENVKAFVAGFLPRPTEPSYPQALAATLHRLTLEGGRRTLALFTSRRMLQATLPYLEGVHTLVQGRDGERNRLVRRFRTERPPVLLMGLDTLWEGVDLPGDQVEVVVIARLPFPVPSDPLVQAEAQRMREEGHDPFRLLFLPRAVLRLRQGAGRLVRSVDDRGLLVLADPRAVTERYGRTFLQALPVPPQVASDTDELLAALRDTLEIDPDLARGNDG